MGHVAEQQQPMAATVTAEEDRPLRIHGVSVPLWEGKSRLGPHIKNTATSNHKSLTVFEVNLQLCVGQHPQPSWAACGTWAAGWTHLA